MVESPLDAEELARGLEVFLESVKVSVSIEIQGRLELTLSL